MSSGIPKPPPPEHILSIIKPQFQKIELKNTLYRIYHPLRRDKTERQALDFEYKFKNHRFDHHDYIKTDSIACPFETISINRGVYYAAPNLELTEKEEDKAISCCIAECYGDTRIIYDIETRKICCIQPKEDLNLLDLRGKAGMQAGIQAGIGSDCTRITTQKWSKYFYSEIERYSRVDGLIYTSRHNGIAAIVLYERAKNKLIVKRDGKLSDHDIRPKIEDLADELAIVIAP